MWLVLFLFLFFTSLSFSGNLGVFGVVVYTLCMWFYCSSHACWSVYLYVSVNMRFVQLRYMGRSTKLCTSNYHWGWPISNKYFESVFCCDVYLSLVLYIDVRDIKNNIEWLCWVASVYILGGCCRCFSLWHFLLACQECVTESKVPSDCELSWFETYNDDVFPCWTDGLAFQKTKL